MRRRWSCRLVRGPKRCGSRMPPAQLARSRSVWRHPDVLPLDAWKAREIERRAASGERPSPHCSRPRKSGSCGGRPRRELTHDLDLVARGPLARACVAPVTSRRNIALMSARCAARQAVKRDCCSMCIRLVLQKARTRSARHGYGLACRRLRLADAPAAGSGLYLDRRRVCATLAAARETQGCSTRIRASPRDLPNAARAVLASDHRRELERIADWCRERS